MKWYSRTPTCINLPNMLLLLISLLLAACNTDSTQIASQTVEAQRTTLPNITDPAPANSPVPPEPSVLLFHSSSNEAIYASVFQILEQKTDALGWQLDPREELIPSSLPASVKWMILLGPISDSTALDAAALIEGSPQTPFLTIGIPDLGEFPNLSRLAPDGFRLDQLGFISGHLASVITEEWRIGIIVQTDQQRADILQQSYANGRTFYCGICRLSYPPFVDYPIAVSLHPDAGIEEWDAALQVMLDNAVQTVFVYSNAIPDEIMDRSLREGLTLLGSPIRPENAAGNWAASLFFDPGSVLQERWNPLETEKLGWTESVPLTIMDVDPTLLSPGRLQWVEDMRSMVEAGMIDPAVTPAPTE